MCAYCGGIATMHSTGNMALGVPPHDLCDWCMGRIANHQFDPVKHFNPPPPRALSPSLAASSWSRSLSLSSSPPPTQNVHQNIASRITNPSSSPLGRTQKFLSVVEKTGPVIGYRAWTVEENRLVGFAAGADLGAWPAGAIKASCLMGRHFEPPPSADCYCGWHAWAEAADIEQTTGVAVGAVQLWGKLIEYGHSEKPEDVEGWRAEWCRPLVLLRWAHKNNTVWSKELADYYKVATAETWEGLTLLATELAR